MLPTLSDLNPYLLTVANGSGPQVYLNQIRLTIFGPVDSEHVPMLI
jgi:hypothetical protein